MRNRRLTGVALGVLGAGALLLSGCTTDDAGTPSAAGSSAAVPSAGTSSSAADPAAAAALGQAATALGTTSFKATITAGPGLKVDVAMDPPNGKGTGTFVATGTNTQITAKSLLIGQDLYGQLEGVTKPGTWTRIDVSRLPAGVNLGLRPGQIDPANAAQLLSATTDVQQADSRSYRGTLDLTKAAEVAGLGKVTIDTYGPAAQDIPFTAGVDEQGRLSALTLQLPAVGGQPATPLEVLYTDYGAPVTAEKPAASEIIEAPDNFYTSLGG